MLITLISFFLARKGVSHNHLLMINNVVCEFKAVTVHQKLWVWGRPRTTAWTKALWENTSPLQPADPQPQGKVSPDSRKGSRWGLQGNTSSISPAPVTADPRLPSSNLAAHQLDYKFLKGREHIFYIFPVSIWCKGKKKLNFWAAGPARS